MNRTCDFSGYATRANLRCSDGRVIMPGAFKDADGQEVPLVWNHIHNDPFNVLGKAILEHREDGVYAYCTFNETEQGKNAKMLVEHGDVVALSICANKLKQDGSKVMHGKIRELSLVLAGANPGAFIDSVSLSHGEESSDEAIIYTGENIMLYHSDEEKDPKQQTPPADEGKKGDDKEETVEDVVNSMNEKQKTVMYALIGQALEDAKGDDKSDEEDDDKEEKSMKHNVFDSTDMTNDQNVLTHADGEAIVKLAKSSNVGTLQTAIGLYADEHFDGGEDSLQHAFEDMEVLFPEYKDVRPGMPETLKRDILLFDFKKFFENVSHAVIKADLNRKFDDERLINFGEKSIDSFGLKGLGLGNQDSQIWALDSANRLDHYIKEVLRVKCYCRYMDDGYLIHPSKEFLTKCLDAIKAICQILGITLNQKKTQIVKLSHGFRWLKVRYYLTETGKVVRKIYKRSLTRMRRKLKALHRKYIEGIATFSQITTSFQCWLAYATKFHSYHTRNTLISLFDDLFTEEMRYRKWNILKSSVKLVTLSQPRLLRTPSIFAAMKAVTP